jgi:hypothetical protein
MINLPLPPELDHGGEDDDEMLDDMASRLDTNPAILLPVKWFSLYQMGNVSIHGTNLYQNIGE